ncbi:MAG TPA: hypothetical protein VK178_15930 [Opitutaceae bacterium]|nr:hypothetical protein [Opitutaceae bacterium]
MKTCCRVLLSGLVAVLFSTLACAQVDPALQTKIDHEIDAAKTLAADPAIVAAVQAHNAAPSADAAAMTQEKWKSLTLLDPFVRSFSKNPAGEVLKAQKSAFISEAFLSGADGTKVAFLAKPSNWSHRGKAKHDVPMSGKVWQGEIEVDESTGLQQVQVAVPVLDGATPIGSLVVGLSVTKLRN